MTHEEIMAEFNSLAKTFNNPLHVAIITSISSVIARDSLISVKEDINVDKTTDIKNRLNKEIIRDYFQTISIEILTYLLENKDNLDIDKLKNYIESFHKELAKTTIEEKPNLTQCTMQAVEGSLSNEIQRNIKVSTLLLPTTQFTHKIIKEIDKTIYNNTTELDGSLGLSNSPTKK